MSRPSFRRFDYALRPAKNMERKMMCEAMARLSLIAPLRQYRYIGFGSVGFHDFGLVHQRLNIHDMISIEGQEDHKDRFSFNRPYSCIKMMWGMSYEVLPQIPWEKKRSIVWLDYEHHLNSKMLGDISLIAGAARSGTMLIVTVPADPGEFEPGANMPEKRLDQLKSRVSRVKVPNDITGESLAKWGMAKAYRRIIHNEIQEALFNRNGALQAEDRVTYQQLFHFNYADGTKMVTVGGVLLNDTDSKKLPTRSFSDLDFIRDGDQEYLIETPVLTRREIRYLNERLPRFSKNVGTPKWLPEEERKKYGRIYRYFPSFGEVESS